MKRCAFCILIIFAFIWSESPHQIANDMANGIAPNAAFSAGAGNIAPANVSSFPGINFGVGFGSVIHGSYWDMMENGYSKAATVKEIGNSIPLFYTIGFFKIGLPKKLLKSSDLGVRYGTIPRVGYNILGTKASIAQYHIGAELRKNIFKLPSGLVKIDFRLSGDYDEGSVNLTRTRRQYNVDFELINKNKWSGFSIGAKTVAGFNLPFLNIFAGIGANYNQGTVNSSMKVNGATTFYGRTFSSSVEGSAAVPYEQITISGLAGVKLLFILAAAEYCVSTHSIAATLCPIFVNF